jgi:uncharacterized protein
MSILDFVVLTAAGLAGGTLNSMAAGGGVIMVLALLLTGMPAQVAVATSQVAIPASFLPAIGPAWRRRREYQPMLPALAGAAAGTALGVWLVAQLDAATFRLVAPVLLLAAAGLLLVQPRMPHILAARADDRPGIEPARRRVAMGVGLFGVAIYAGAFGGGVAVAVLAVFAVLTPWSWDQANATKNLTCLVMSIVASVAFLLTGLAAWWPAMVLAVSQLAGGAVGQWAAGHVSEEHLRKTVAVATCAGAVLMVGNS